MSKLPCPFGCNTLIKGARTDNLDRHKKTCEKNPENIIREHQRITALAND